MRRFLVTKEDSRRVFGRITIRLLAVAFALIFCAIKNSGYAQEFSEIQRLADQGNADAQYKLGAMYSKGLDVA